MIDHSALGDRFISMFRRSPRIFRAPGRVNLIGEHTDYNGGFVLPMAIDLEAAVAIDLRDDRKFRIHTVNYDETAEFDLDLPYQEGPVRWLRFIEGVARILHDRGMVVRGADLVVWSDVPAGAGLSSSAALETAVGLALTETAGTPIDRVTLALIGQQTEHDYVGANVGIMDQFVSAQAERGHALLLDCRSLGYENVPLDTARTAIVICDTRVKHDLAASEYNTRRAECEMAVRFLSRELPHVKELRDITPIELKEFGRKIPEKLRRRAMHVVTENERTLQAAEALRNKDMTGFGWLMNESHRSLRDDYEVSSEELDRMVEIAMSVNGVLGSRMTGGGFGGSTVNLVLREAVEGFCEIVSAEYERASGTSPVIMVAEPCDGASEVTPGAGNTEMFRFEKTR